MASTRPPAVAGLFYPDDPRELEAQIQRFLSEASVAGPVPKAIIAPHAGYIYSGPVAASAYAMLAPARGTIERVVLLGPAHRVPLRGLAVSSADSFLTPLGPVPVDVEARDRLLELPQVRVWDTAHAQEHSLEVHLPMLQTVLGEFSLVPLVVGEATADEVSDAIDAVWEEPYTLVVVSSDLSHYHDYTTARRLDEATSQAIEGLHGSRLGYEDACGRNPIRGLLESAHRRGLRAQTVDLRNSGDTAGPKDRVVGYGAYIFT